MLEACTAYAGPVAAAELADMGAAVIKCELPGTGDICRALAPRVPGAPDLDGSAPFLRYHFSWGVTKNGLQGRTEKAEGCLANTP
jgi:crotonobetainyl-CoA:carnitine CoA-transferase CaiB-like acyl-CoA transferase